MIEWLCDTAPRMLGRLRDYRLRSVLAVSGIAISTASMVLLGDVLASVKANAVKGVADLGGRSLVIAAKQTPMNGRSPRAISLADVDILRRRIPGLKNIAPVVNVTDTVRACGRRRQARVIGIGNVQLLMGVSATAHGRSLRTTDLTEKLPVAVLGTQLANQFDCAFVVGRSTMMIGTHVYRVIGETDSRNPDVMPADAVYIPMGVAEARYAPVLQRSVTLTAQITPGADVGKVQRSVRERLRTMHRLVPTDADDFTIQSDTAAVDEFERSIDLLTAGLVALLSVSALVGAIGVMNSVLTAVIERTPEIGLRRTVGATRKSIREQFVVESVALGTTGGLVGAVAGVCGSEVFAWIVDIQARHNTQVLAFAMVLSAVLGVAAGVLPAVRAASLAPVDALRYE